MMEKVEGCFLVVMEVKGFEKVLMIEVLILVPKVDDVSLVDGVLNDAFGGDGEEDFVMGEGVVMSSLSLDMSINSCLGGMIVSLIFLEGLKEEAWVESMEVEEKWRI
ncbi:hypothetical protein Tco_1068744 [Tanacetum coccineum]|uniref:Uncharacterized protein n=1 Tax=Tanacetum coccineum TaxID=301880 RepID=A0ABQ5HIF4_9ASTR